MLQTLWINLNGKKTNIGATMLLVAVILTKLNEIWGIDAVWIKAAVDSLEYIGGLFSGVGLAHKVIK